MIARASRYFHTLRHLRLRQWTGRAWHALPKPRPGAAPTPLRHVFEGDWAAPLWREPSLVGPAEFRFAQQTRSVRAHADWRPTDVSDLWLYNLHYFDDLNAADAGSRGGWHRAWIESWIAGNPVGVGRGWDPYPTSLRMVNWVRWALRRGKLPVQAVASLATQARWLERRLETHLLGNHLWSNAKALCFVGAFFEGDDADRWLRTGLRLLGEELDAQRLPDGGHFERSPMYHGLFLEDALDLLQLARLRPAAFPAGWPAALAESAGRMLDWMGHLVHPDGDIAFFNDSTLGICPPLRKLAVYAALLDVPVRGEPVHRSPLPHAGLRHLQPSGFLRLQGAGATLFADVGGVGPDHLPGHAHAGTLSFELSLGGARMVVNGGVSVYGTGPERQRQRGSRAHSTLVVDGEDSSEVWAGFRVARRARVVATGAREGADDVLFWAVHDGYRRLAGSPLHKRTWRLGAGGLLIEDAVTGSGRHRLEILLHLAPGWSAQPEGTDAVRFRASAPSADVEDIVLHFQPPFEAVIEAGTWHPRFGVSERSESVALRATVDLPVTHQTRISWRNAA